MKIKGAIFDADGTLIDSMNAWRTRGSVFLKKLGIDIDDERYIDAKYSGSLESSKFLRKEFSLDLSEEEISRGTLKVMEEFYQNEATLKKGTIEFLEELKNNGVRMCVATATYKRIIVPALQRCGILHYFDYVFTCGEFNTDKSEPYLFEKAAEFMGTAKEDTVVFEDALYAAKTAHEAGFFVTGIFDETERNQSEFQKTCDIFVHDLNESLKFIL